MSTFAVRVAVILSAVTLALATTSPVNGQATASHTFHAHGDAAQFFVDSCNPECIVAFLTVFRGGTVQQPETFLEYSLQAYDGSKRQVDGYGNIPNQSFVVTGNKIGQLNVDTSMVPGFVHRTGIGGPLHITWTKDGVLRETSHGTSQVRIANELFTHQVGTSTFDSAPATGSILGYEIRARDVSNLGRAESTTVTKTR